MNTQRDIGIMIHPDMLPEQKEWHTFEKSVFNLRGLPFRPYDVAENGNILGDTSIILDADYKIFEPSIEELLYWTPAPFPFESLNYPETKDFLLQERLHCLTLLRHHYLKYFGYRTVTYDSGRVIYLCHPFGWYAYGHLHDSLQRLFSVSDIIRDEQIRFAVSSYDAVKDFTEHLSALCEREITEHHLITIDATKVHRFDDLIIPYSPAMPTNYTQESYCWIVNRYFKRFLTGGSSQERIPGIYLSRNHVIAGSRSVLNETDVVHLLTERGFTVVYGTEPLEGIVRLFHAAEVVVGPHGSVLANTIFCRREARIIEYCADNRVDCSFKNKLKQAIDYKQIIVPGDSGYNISIPIDHLTTELSHPS